MLFVASGAFHEHKPSELLAELQGRLPIRVELKGLDASDLQRILTETKFNLLEQQRALLVVEGVQLAFDAEGVTEIARLAAEVNRSVENIGARRLHTVIEKIMEDISYNASDLSSLYTAAHKEGDAEAAAAAKAKFDALTTKMGVAVGAGEGGLVRLTVDRALVRRKLLPMLERSDFSKFIL
jgi:ATP-dependent protease Clp ATPase subunit